jgi:predicted kinase
MENSPLDSRVRVKDIQLLLRSLGQLPEPVKKPVFIALTGLPGTGKSYLSRILASKLQLVILESDAFRKILFSHPVYSWRENERLFLAIYVLIEELLKKGVSLVLDATNLSERNRKKLYHIAENTKAKFILIKLEAPSEVVRERLKNRMKDSVNLSEADWEVHQSMKLKVEGIRHKHYVVNTAEDINPIIDTIMKEAKN